MAMLGFGWVVYASDDGRNYALKVDLDYINDGRRGWSLAASPSDYQYPRGWWPRRVIGLAPDGRVREAIVAGTGAPLWSGAASSFDYRDTNGAMVTAQVIGRKKERWLRIP